MNCPWCGASRSPSRDADKYLGREVAWACGSCKHGREPWQSPECRISQLEAQLERLREAGSGLYDFAGREGKGMPQKKSDRNRDVAKVIDSGIASAYPLELARPGKTVFHYNRKTNTTREMVVYAVKFCLFKVEGKQEFYVTYDLRSRDGLISLEEPGWMNVCWPGSLNWDHVQWLLSEGTNEQDSADR